MNKPALILVGAGGHARSCIDVIEQQGKYQIGGFIGLHEEINSWVMGYRIIATDDELAALARRYAYAFVSVGHIRTAEHRSRLYKLISDCGFQLPTLISPTAHVSQHAQIGEGTIIMHGAIVNAGAKVGNNCIINTRAIIEHDATVGDHCHISTGAILNGSVTVDSGCFIGSGTTVKEGVAIGRACLVGMGLTVRHAISDNSRYTGCDRT